MLDARSGLRRSNSAPRSLFTRPDLLAVEAQKVFESGRNWRARLAQLGDYGTSGGSAADRRAIVEWMAYQEVEHA